MGHEDTSGAQLETVTTELPYTVEGVYLGGAQAVVV